MVDHTSSLDVVPSRRFKLPRQMSVPAYVAILALLVVVIAIVVGPFLSPYGAAQINPMDALQGPSWRHWLGTDQFGRDILTRISVGGGATLGLALICTVASMTFGTAIGLVCGYYGGAVDQVLMRLMDVILAVPALLIALLILAAFGSSMPTLVGAITVMFIPPVSRVARTAAMRVAHLAYVDAARVRRESSVGIMVLELLPNMLPVLAVEAGIRLSYTILNLASLGFLGLGVQPPTPDWGLMISEGSANLTTAPWVVAGPAAAIVILVLSVNILLDEFAN